MTMYAPFALYFMVLSARATDRYKLTSLVKQACVIVPPVELASRYYRDKLYWPIVREVYIELKQLEDERDKV